MNRLIFSLFAIAFLTSSLYSESRVMSEKVILAKKNKDDCGCGCGGKKKK